MKRPLMDYGRKGIRLDFPVFDVHAHVGHFGGAPSPTLECQIREMDRIGIRTAAVSSVEGLFGDVRGGNDNVREASDKFPNRLIGYCHVSAQYPELIKTELERCFRHPGFKGIKVYQVGTNFDHRCYDPVWAFAKARRLPVLAHTWGGNLTGFDKVARKFPTVAFMAAHTGSGFAYQSYVDAAKKTRNLYLDLTYSREHTNMIEYFVEEVGADRIVWGSDAPTFSMSQQVGKILFARISDADKHKILYGTAARLFRL
jgi:predicted TIM-barrel fold metal-dependent hydrolase